MGASSRLLSLEAYLEREARSRRKHEFVEGVAYALAGANARIDTREKRTAYLGLPGLRGYLRVESRRPSLTLYRKTPEGLVEERGRLWLPCLDLELDPEEVYRL